MSGCYTCVCIDILQMLPSSTCFLLGSFQGVDFIGREALAYRREKGVQQRVCLLEMEGGGDVEVWPHASEPVLRNGQVVGSTQSVAFGFRRGYHLVTVLLFPRDQGEQTG